MNDRRSGRRICGLSIAIGAVLALSALEACSASADKPDACKLIDPAAAGKILGTKVTVKPVDTSAAGKDAASLCSYQTGSIHGGFLLLAGRLNADNLAAEVASQKKSVADNSGAPPGVPLPKVTVRDVPDLGDAAFLATSDQFFELHVFAHGDKLVVTRNVAPTPAAIDQSEELARSAIAHLP